MKRFDIHAPLNAEDSEKQTLGCRHTNPKICGKNSMPGVCAFVQNDEMCQSPPKSWPKQFQKLSQLYGNDNK